MSKHAAAPASVGSAPKAMKYEPDRPPAGQANAVYSSWGFPLFACAWSRHTGRIYLAGGGGQAGFGASSGIVRFCRIISQCLVMLCNSH